MLNTNAKWSDFHFRLTTGCDIAPGEVWKVPANKFLHSKKVSEKPKVNHVLQSVFSYVLFKENGQTCKLARNAILLPKLF